MCAWWRHLVNAYGVISFMWLIAAALRRVLQLLAWLNPVVIRGLHASTCYSVLPPLTVLYHSH